MERRTFIFAGIAAAMNAAMGNPAEPPQLETLTQWLVAPRKARQAALGSCLDRIRSIDTSIHAWVQVAPQRPTGDGKLSEIPFGAKDIMETRGLSTEYGSPFYKGRIGITDAATVRDLRQRGAIMIGKTQCTAFAYRTPAPTRNPHDLNHTPGGSSSGSAAAVAPGWCHLLSGLRLGGQYCDRLPFVVWPDSNPPMVFSPWKAFFPSRRAWILLDSSYIHQPICWRSGNRWDTPQGGQRILRWEHPNPCLRSSRRWQRRFRMYSQNCERLACPSAPSLSPRCWTSSTELPVLFRNMREHGSSSNVLRNTARGLGNLWTLFKKDSRSLSSDTMRPGGTLQNARPEWRRCTRP